MRHTGTELPWVQHTNYNCMERDTPSSQMQLQPAQGYSLPSHALHKLQLHVGMHVASSLSILPMHQGSEEL